MSEDCVQVDNKPGVLMFAATLVALCGLLKLNANSQHANKLTMFLLSMYAVDCLVWHVKRDHLHYHYCLFGHFTTRVP